MQITPATYRRMRDLGSINMWSTHRLPYRLIPPLVHRRPVPDSSKADNPTANTRRSRSNPPADGPNNLVPRSHAVEAGRPNTPEPSHTAPRSNGSIPASTHAGRSAARRLFHASPAVAPPAHT